MQATERGAAMARNKKPHVVGWVVEDDRRPLLSVDDVCGYDQLLAGHGYQFGAVKR